MPSIKVHKPGLCTTVQDIGRIGYQQFGIPVSGVMDEFAFTVANYLVESDKNNAVLEIPFLGPTLEFDFDVTIAITGADIQPKINNQDIKMWQSINVKKGDTLSFGGLKTGIRTYLAFSAEIDVPIVMGSKSTLLKLIMRFWDVDSGKIVLDRKDVKATPLKNLYQKFNYMTQSTSLFIGNIRDNLLVAKADATDEEIYIALKKASFYDYVISLPDKLDSIVEEGGKNFSGGERQRIGLARAFLANREFFLLDEPTSNLDILNEAIILKSLADEAKDKTVILVSHRESTLSICNNIFKI